MSRFCTSCGFEIPQGNAFCPGCGQVTQQDPAKDLPSLSEADERRPEEPVMLAAVEPISAEPAPSSVVEEAPPAVLPAETPVPLAFASSESDATAPSEQIPEEPDSTAETDEHCADCGTSLPAGAAFCSACAAPVSGGSTAAGAMGGRKGSTRPAKKGRGWLLPLMLGGGVVIIAVIAVLAFLAFHGKDTPVVSAATSTTIAAGTTSTFYLGFGDGVHCVLI